MKTLRDRLLFLLLATLLFIPPHSSARNRFANYSDVQNILNSQADSLPAALKASATDRERVWQQWVEQHDREIRGRLQGGDADTLANWLLFGKAFTQERRLLFDVPAESAAASRLTSKRIQDFISYLGRKQPDERSIFARRFLLDQGYRVDSAAERTKLAQHLRDEVDRILAERRKYARREDQFQPGDFAGQMMAQSSLFRDRGLSLDTTILPDYAIEQALQTMAKQGLLSPGSIRRVAVIGPGLDFADKNSGYDFYPLQTLQPFMILDSLLRLRLAASVNETRLTAFDISARVNDHIRNARERAGKGAPYLLRLSIDNRQPWNLDLVGYWKTAGDRIGSDTQPPRPPDADNTLDLRTIEVRPGIVAQVSSEDFNVVTERWSGVPFDLVIATNVLVYYDRLDQSLAVAAIEAMLRPGGFFLTNNAVAGFPESRFSALGYATVRHSAEMSDHVFWYRRN